MASTNLQSTEVVTADAPSTGAYGKVLVRGSSAAADSSGCLPRERSVNTSQNRGIVKVRVIPREPRHPADTNTSL